MIIIAIDACIHIRLPSELRLFGPTVSVFSIIASDLNSITHSQENDLS
jgi:hypothetical protein